MGQAILRLMASAKQPRPEELGTHQGPYHVDVIGYCSLPTPELLARFGDGHPEEVARLPGEYTLVFTREEETCIVTSAYGVTQYYYAWDGARFAHGATVAEVVGRAGLSWSWNWRAVACLTRLQHLLEDETLHSLVSRAPARSILWYRGGQLTGQTASWEEIHLRGQGNPDAAVQAFNREVERWAGDDCAISMSGGFDSRLILSALLRLGVKPALFVMGTAESTDMQIAMAIARRFDLRLVPVAIEEDDFLPAGPQAVRLTSGTKTADHWHSLIGPRKAAFRRSTRVFVGANGESARSYYLDKGALARVVDLGPKASLGVFWGRKAKRIFEDDELKGVGEGLASELSTAGRRAAIARLVGLCEGPPLAGLDRFYTEQRVRTFISNGLRLYGASTSWVTPFLGREWVSEILRLPRRWKLGSTWHRYAIRKNMPILMEFPEEGVSDHMTPAARTGYWLVRRRNVTGYTPVRRFLRGQEALSAIWERRRLLQELISEGTLKALIEKQERGASRQLAIACLLTLALYAEQVQKS